MIFPLLLILPSLCLAFSLENDQSLVLSADHRESGSNMVPPNAWNPSWRVKTELRPNLSLSLLKDSEENEFSLQFQPRVTWAKDWKPNEQSWEIKVREASISLGYGPWKGRLGRIHQGWGPSESFSLSNWMVPFLVWEPSPFFEQMGVTKLEVSGVVFEQQLFQLLVELPPWPDSWATPKSLPEEFRKRALLRWDFTSSDGNRNIGITAGTERKVKGNGLRMGGYGSLNVNDSWQLFFDTRHSSRDRGYSMPFDHTLLIGLRNTLESGAEIRGEALHQSNGQNLEEQRSATRASLTLSQPQQLALLRANQQSLKGENYGILSFRWLNLPSPFHGLQNPSVYFRCIRSFTDGSLTAYLGGDGALSDSATLAIYGGTSAGPKNRELNSINKSFLGLNLRLVF